MELTDEQYVKLAEVFDLCIALASIIENYVRAALHISSGRNVIS
jgi:hypothetical protein